jgi:cytochrome c553
MHTHIKRLLIVIAVLVVVAFTARYLARDKSFYQYGHYRGDAPAEIAAKFPVHQGSAACQSCHKGIYTEWVNGIHHKATKDNVLMGIVVKSGPNCEVCHTAAGSHPSKVPLPLSIEDRLTTITSSHEHVHASNKPGRKLMLSPDEMRGLCMNCHEKLAARPKFQPQIVVSTHAGEEVCTTCHNPHNTKVDFDHVPRMVAMKNVVAGNASAGKKIAANCAACHGVNGVSTSGAIPNLAGQHANYLASSLQAFKSKTRDNSIMSAMAASLSEADMENVATFYAQNSCKVTGGNKAKVAAGKAKFASAGCAACHSSGGLRKPGVSGVSASKAWPNLAGQNAEYLSNTQKEFQDGTRHHAVMTSVAKALSSDDVDNLAAFLATTSCK